jgi:hypothetical protein
MKVHFTGRQRKGVGAVTAMTLAAALGASGLLGAQPAAASTPAAAPAPAVALESAPETLFAFGPSDLVDRALLWLVERYGGKDALQELIKRVGLQQVEQWLVANGVDSCNLLDEGCNLVDDTPPPATGVVTGGGLPLNIRSGPGFGYPIQTQASDGSTVQIYCTAEGDAVFGQWGVTALWDMVGNGYVSDGFVNTGTNAPVAPAC